jgi:hypothetical protein
MKKFVVLLAVVAMTCFSAMAFAADVTVGGSYEIRSRDFSNTNVKPENSDAATAGDQRDTQNRIRIDVNAKAGDVKGKLQLEQDFLNSPSTDWGHLESYASGGSNMGFREAWVNFNIPGLPINVTGGHQLLALGNAWFFKSMHYGSDAWVVANQTGPNTFAFVDIKVSEGASVAREDDIDAYAVLDVIKLSDTMTLGVDFTNIRDRRGLVFAGFEHGNLYNLGVNLNATLGALKLKVQGDQQMGGASGAANNPNFKGYELVIQGNVALDPVTVNFTAARGSGQKSDTDNVTQFINFLDIDPHYTFLYEYKVVTAAQNVLTGANQKNTGFANTTALSLGASFAAMKSLTLGLDYWYLHATEPVSINGAPATRDLGQEIDLKINWQLYDNLAWNWVLGYFIPDSAYDSMVGGAAQSADNVTGIQGVLAFKF